MNKALKALKEVLALQVVYLKYKVDKESLPPNNLIPEAVPMVLQYLSMVVD